MRRGGTRLWGIMGQGEGVRYLRGREGGGLMRAYDCEFAIS